MEILLERLNSRFDQEEERISELRLEHSTFKITEAEEPPAQKKRMKKKWREPEAFMGKQNNICIAMRVPEREKGAENLFEETMAKTFPNLRREMDMQIQET